LPSLSFAVVCDRDIVYSQAFGYADLEKRIPARTETVYPAGSITKVFVATMLAQLREAGVVSLETPVRDLLPECQVRSPFPGTRPTTLRQLASHTSGLPQDAAVNFWSDYATFSWIVTGGATEMKWYVPREELLASLNTVELVHRPDVYSHYSNLGVQVLGMALERAAGQPMPDYIRSEILEPLGMKNSFFSPDQIEGPALAVGYVTIDPESPPVVAPDWDLGSAVYSGGLWSTAEDLARFLSLQFQDGEGGGTPILSVGSLRLMRTPQSVYEAYEHECYGIGWGIYRVAGYRVIGHGGAHLGFSARIIADPEAKLGIVALCNTNNPLAPNPCKQLARELFAELRSAIEPQADETAFDPESVELGRYVGEYVLPGEFAMMKVSVEEGRLFVSLIQDPEFNEPFVPVGIHEFSFEADPTRTVAITFEEDEAGSIVRLKWGSHYFQRRVGRGPSSNKRAGQTGSPVVAAWRVK
jgi:CubicO group peptidase (beta-lactamase class C family)